MKKYYHAERKLKGQWALKEAKEQAANFVNFQSTPYLNPLGCLMLLMLMPSAYANTRSHEFRSPADNSLRFQDGNCSISSAPSATLFAHASTAAEPLLVDAPFPAAALLEPASATLSAKVKSAPPTPSIQGDKEQHPKPYAKFFVDATRQEFPIKIDPKLQKHIDALKRSENPRYNRGSEILKNRVTDFIKLVRDALLTLPINKEIIARVKKTNLEIVILPEINPRDGHLRGAYYDAEFNQIGIYLQVTTIKDLQKTLLNEFSHAAVVTKNFNCLQKKVSEIKLMTTYIDESGEMNKSKKAELVEAHKEFRNNVDKFIGIHQKKLVHKALTTEEKDFFDKVAEAIHNDHLFRLHKIKFDQNDFMVTKKRGHVLHQYPDGSLRLSKNFLGLGKHDIHLYPNLNVIQLAPLANFNYVFPGEPESEIISFIDEMETLQAAFAKSEYTAKSEDGIISEYSSSIDELAPSLKRLLAPKWCEYFSKFHQVIEYCSRPSL